MRFSGLLPLLLAIAYGAPQDTERVQRDKSVVTWDNHSVRIHGEPVMIYAGEVHAYRYPGYTSLVEVFQKLKAAGFNTISTYFYWGMIEPRRGHFNWDTYRDPQLFFDAAKEVGLYVIARPGPYIHSEVSSGGMPGWMQRVQGPHRNSGDNFTQAYMPYMQEILKIISENQIDQGGPVIALQLENEYDEAVGGEDFEYQRLLAKAAEDAAITVPTTHNGALSSAFSNFFIKHVDLWGYDEYPATGTACPGPDTWEADAVKQFQWDMHMDPKYNPEQPMAIYEFQGGFKQTWGDAGYCDQQGSVDFQRMFNKNKYSMATTIFNVYMVWGGTNWGYLSSPDCYTSYDFGAMIGEDRSLRNKYHEAKLQGHFLRSSPAYLSAVPQNIGNNTMAFVESSEKNLTVTYTEDVKGKKTKFFFTRHTDASFLGESLYKLTLPTSQGEITVPQLKGRLSLRGRDTKIHVVDYAVGKHTLLYSSSEVMTSLVMNDVTTVVLYGDHGQTHETAIVLDKNEKISLFEGDKATFESKVEGDSLILNYVTEHKTVVRIGDNLLLYLLDRETAYQTWPDLESKSLVLGGHLIRDVSKRGKDIHISGDLNETSTIELVAPKDHKTVFFNGRKVKSKGTKYDTQIFQVSPHLPEVKLPILKYLTWKSANSLPETDNSYNDSKWDDADLGQSFNPNELATPVSLMAGDYGYHVGVILWRGHFTASEGEKTLNIDVHGGQGFAYSVYDNGVFLGSYAGSKGIGNYYSHFDLPEAWSKGEKHLVTVVQDHHGYDMAWIANTEDYKAPRGILGYNFTSSSGTIVEPTSVRWKVQGNFGGESHVDETRGPYNEGGLYGERLGWHLPDFPDGKWNKSSPFDGVSGVGVSFYRTTFDLAVPEAVDYPMSFQLPQISSKDPYRAFIYVNGYQFGRFASSLGPQTKFPIPPSILNLNGKNTLAVALWSLNNSTAIIDSFTLGIDQKLEYSGPKFGTEPAPKYSEKARRHAS